MSKTNILLGVTGSVAAIKLKELVEQLTSLTDVNVCIVPTRSALHFVPDFKTLFGGQLPLNERINALRRTMDPASSGGPDEVFSFTDEDEWLSWTERGDPVLHIELRKWAHMLLIAPLDANTLGKLANGMCDNLLTCVARAWDLTSMQTRPVLICPAMNTFMYQHPITSKQLYILVEDFGFTLIECVEKRLVCGDVGMGAMASLNTIVDRVAYLRQWFRWFYFDLYILIIKLGYFFFLNKLFLNWRFYYWLGGYSYILAHEKVISRHEKWSDWIVNWLEYFRDWHND